jgi:hypothetical protein
LIYFPQRIILITPYDEDKQAEEVSAAQKPAGNEG